MLLAIDGNQRIMGANRFARTSLMLDDRGLRAGTSLWSIFERNVDIFRHQDRTDFSVLLLIAGSNDSRPALVTPPDRFVTASNNPTNHDLHTRPRLGSIDVSTLPPAEEIGLSYGQYVNHRVSKGVTEQYEDLLAPKPDVFRNGWSLLHVSQPRGAS